MTHQINNELIFKNTLMLYIRMGLVMVVSLYTSRVLLKALGVEDYGIYNIVGGVVVLFSFLNNILTVAIRRFLSIAIAEDDGHRVHEILRASVRAVMIIALVLALLMETAGLWFVNNKLNIPPDRLFAANWAFQLSILSFIFNLNALPYNAAIVSYERMNIYAYIGIFEVVLKLAFTFCVLYIDGIDKLILYSVLFFILSNAIRFIDVWYCKKYLICTQGKVVPRKEDIRAIFGFSSWAVMGSAFFLLATEGVNIIMNLFFGVVLNAAMGISQTVSNAVSQFGGNFLTAFNPPLTKSYASERLSENTYSFTLRATRISILLMSLISIPLILNINDILNVWLVEVPKFAAEICIIAIVYVSIDMISSPLYILVYADGDIKTYSIVLSIIQFIYVIVFYVACKLGADPVQALSFNVVCAVALHVARLLMLKKIMDFNVLGYCRKTLLPVLAPLTLVLLSQHFLLDGISGSNLPMLIIKLMILEAILISLMFFLYIDKKERDYLFRLIKSKF